MIGVCTLFIQISFYIIILAFLICLVIIVLFFMHPYQWISFREMLSALCTLLFWSAKDFVKSYIRSGSPPVFRVSQDLCLGDFCF